eukprot:PITA_27058
MSGYATTQKILHAGYFWLSLFKDCITAVQKCHNCQIFDRKMRAPPAPLHPIIVVGPFAKWGIDFITCNPHLAGGHAYIILAVDYFTKWAETMPTFLEDGKTAVILIFNHIIARCRFLSKYTSVSLMALVIVHRTSLPQPGLSIHPLTS